MKILVIDNHERCGDCPLLERFYDDEHEEWYEWCCYKRYKIEDTESELKDCPLKPMPQKIDISEDELYEKQYMCFEGGWNACLDEILGEEE